MRLVAGSVGGWWALGCSAGILSGPAAKDISKIANVDGWNNYRIIARGNRIQLILNDHMTVDYLEEDPEIAKSGVIALQVHGGPACEIWYKDMSIVQYPAGN